MRIKRTWFSKLQPQENDGGKRRKNWNDPEGNAWIITFLFFFFNSFISLFILLYVVWFCRCPDVFFFVCFFLKHMFCLIKSCPQYAVLLSPKPGAILCQTVDNHFTQALSLKTLMGLSKHSDYTVKQSKHLVSLRLWTSRSGLRR